MNEIVTALLPLHCQRQRQSVAFICILEELKVPHRHHYRRETPKAEHAALHATALESAMKRFHSQLLGQNPSPLDGVTKHLREHRVEAGECVHDVQ
jgi:hypothetical protein